MFALSLAKDAGQVLVDQIRMGETVNRFTVDEMVITKDPFLGETEILEYFNQFSPNAVRLGGEFVKANFASKFYKKV